MPRQAANSIQPRRTARSADARAPRLQATVHVTADGGVLPRTVFALGAGVGAQLIAVAWLLGLGIVGMSCDGLADDDCRVVGDNACSKGCSPILTGSTSIHEPCQVVGKFMGCAPALGSEFWRDRANNETSGLEGVCDLLRGELPYFHCFEGKLELYWFFKNIEIFCNGECGMPAITVCD